MFGYGIRWIPGFGLSGLPPKSPKPVAAEGPNFGLLAVLGSTPSIENYRIINHIMTRREKLKRQFDRLVLMEKLLLERKLNELQKEDFAYDTREIFEKVKTEFPEWFLDRVETGLSHHEAYDVCIKDIHRRAKMLQAQGREAGFKARAKGNRVKTPPLISIQEIAEWFCHPANVDTVEWRHKEIIASALNLEAKK
jgi:hypothetical protein